MSARAEDPKPRNKPKSSWPDACFSIVSKLVDNGLGALVVFSLLLIGLAWVTTSGLTSADRKEIIMAITQNPILGVAGWMVAIALVFIFRYIYRDRDATHEREMQRVADVKNIAVQTRLKLPLQSSEPPEQDTDSP